MTKSLIHFPKLFLMLSFMAPVFGGSTVNAQSSASPWSCANVLSDNGVAAFRILDALNAVDPSKNTCKRLKVYFSCSNSGDALAAVSVADAAGSATTSILNLNRPDGSLFATDEFMQYERITSWGDRQESITIELAPTRELISFTLEKNTGHGPGGSKSQTWTCGAP